jgi:hypothetical protein
VEAQSRQELRVCGAGGSGELHEADIGTSRDGWRDRDLLARGAGDLRAELVLEEDQRAHRVARGDERVGLAHHVAEDLQGQRTAVAGLERGCHHACHVERALAWEAAEVPAPVQHVHVQKRCVGDLEEADVVTVDAGQGAAGVAAGKHVEGVDRERDGPVVGPADDGPSLADPVDVPSPGERLVGHRHAEGRGELADGVQLLDGQVGVVDRVW